MVSTTDSVSAWRRYWAMSSRPGASGTGRFLLPASRRLGRLGVLSRLSEHLDLALAGRHDLLGAAGAVAVAPALLLVVLDHVAQAEDPVHERLGPGRAAGHVHVDRHELVRRRERVVVEHAHGAAAGAHRDRPLGLEHLVVQTPDDRRHLDRDPARQDDEVGLAGGGAQGLEAEARDVHARPDHAHHLDRAAGQAEREREDRVASRPRDRLVERGRDDPLLHVRVEVLALEVAAQHVARAQLADAEVVRGLLPPHYLHSRAPLRQTYTRATSSNTMKTTVSTRAKVPNARSWIATG